MPPHDNTAPVGIRLRHLSDWHSRCSHSVAGNFRVPVRNKRRRDSTFRARRRIFWDCQHADHSLVEIRLKAEARARIRWVRRGKDGWPSGPASFLPMVCSLLQRPESMEARMLDAFFWYTGFVFWILVAAGAACFVAADANDRNVRRRRLISPVPPARGPSR